MAFTDHKINAFTHKITDLADQPNMPPDELKARFDSSSEELRVAHNAICDEGDALSARVDYHDTQINQISMEKFPDDTIQEKNLHPDLAAKLNAKADETALSAAVETLEAADAAETAAREASDTALSGRIDTITAQKCEIYCGIYRGDNAESQSITLGFQPKAVIVTTFGGYHVGSPWETGATIAYPGNASYYLEITSTGFLAKYGMNDASTKDLNPYFYVAFR